VAEEPSESRGDANLDGGPVHLLVIGCGNPMAGDDSAGPEIIHRLEARGDCRCELRYIPQAGPDLLETFRTADVLVFVDAVSSGAQPGTLHLVPLPSRIMEPRAVGAISSHGWGLTETLDLARALRRPLPRLLLLGVEVAGAEQGAPRSAAVEQAIALVVERFPNLQSLLLKPEAGVWSKPRHFAPGDASFPGE